MTEKDRVVFTYVEREEHDIGTGYRRTPHGWLAKFYFWNWYWLGEYSFNKIHSAAFYFVYFFCIYVLFIIKRLIPKTILLYQ